MVLKWYLRGYEDRTDMTSVLGILLGIEYYHLPAIASLFFGVPFLVAMFWVFTIPYEEYVNPTCCRNKHKPLHQEFPKSKRLAEEQEETKKEKVKRIEAEGW